MDTFVYLSCVTSDRMWSRCHVNMYSQFSLMRHLRSSVELQLSDNCSSIEAEKRYQETLINTMAQFANSLPDYQKVGKSNYLSICK